MKKGDEQALSVRPYQLLCVVCALGEEGGPKDTRLAGLLERVRRAPDAPVALRCNAGDVYVYQDPGRADDTPEGEDFNRKRDLDILQRLDLAPGSVLPARILFRLLLRAIPTVTGICGYETTTADKGDASPTSLRAASPLSADGAQWKGCPRAKSGAYERAQKKGINAILPPRGEEEMARNKQESLALMYQAEAIKVRPHILICAVSQFGGGVRPPFKPDNLPELIELIRKKPETRVTLVAGADWMMCAPCPSLVPDLSGCVCGHIGTGGLYNELKDLNVLQCLGLTYGTTMTARALYKLIFERIPKTAGVCALKPNPSQPNAIWHDPCGDKDAPCPSYEKGRETLMKEFV